MSPFSWRQTRSTGETAVRLEGAAALCAVLSAALRAGLTPERCLEVAGVGRQDERLRLVAGGLVGASWDVAIESGAAPARLLGRLAELLTSVASSMRQAEVAAAGPRATIRLVIWLPIASLLLAQLAGIPALAVLLLTPVGVTMLVAGVVLLWAARVWLTTLITRAQRYSWATGLAPDLVAMALHCGASPATAWQLVEQIPEQGYLTDESRQRDVASCHEAVTQSDEWGVPAAAMLELRARLLRRAEAQQREATVAALAVHVLLPLGVCVLPAFVLLAVVPSVLALLSSTGLSGG